MKRIDFIIKQPNELEESSLSYLISQIESVFLKIRMFTFLHLWCFLHQSEHNIKIKDFIPVYSQL